jgi:DNA-binding NtrC family response regulator
MTMAQGLEPLVVVAAADPAALGEVGPLLRACGCRVAAAGDRGQLAAAVAAEAPALLLLDPGLDGDASERLLSDRPGLPVAFLAERDSSLAGETAVRRGAFDYLTWPLDPHRLRVIVAHAVERHRLLERIHRLEAAAGAEVDATDGHLRAIDRLEKRAIVDALRRASGNVREAARLLGFGQATVYRKIKRYCIPLPGRARPASVPEITSHPQDPARSCG